VKRVNYKVTLVAESKGTLKEVHFDESNSPKCLFTDKDNLYFVLQEGTKIFKNNPKYIYVCPHNTLAFRRLCDEQVVQIYCYGDYIYYVNDVAKSFIYRIKKDGSEKETFLSQKAAATVSVYNDRVYFLNFSLKDQLSSVNLDGQNMANVGSIRTSWNYFISNDVVYYSSGLNMQNKISYYNMRDDSNGVTSKLDGRAINIVNGFAFIQPEAGTGQSAMKFDAAKRLPWMRYDIIKNESINYEGVPTINDVLLDKATVNVANGMVYFGNKYGVFGRLPLNGGQYKAFL
jgi:hypothetical protein